MQINAHQSCDMQNNKPYVIGFDLGDFSVGMSAIQIDSEGLPTRILNSQSVIHDSGVDPSQRKYGTSRKKEAGIARRIRRMRRYRKHRLNKLSQILSANGYKRVDIRQFHGPDIWLIRASAADQYIANEDARRTAIRVSCEHIARHRGWRNPYQNPRVLLHAQPDSAAYGQLRENAADHMGGVVPADNETPAQIVRDVLDYHRGEPAIRLRHTGKVTRKTKKNQHTPCAWVLPERMMQSDNAYELRRILETQQVPEPLIEQLILAVFYQISPKGSAEHLAGKDAIDPTRIRAPKCSLAFQRYRIADVISNLRVGSEQRRLTVEEKQAIARLLASDNKQTCEYETWAAVAETLDHPATWLKGIGKPAPDGEENVTNRPPHIDILHRISQLDDNTLRVTLLNWWDSHTTEDKESFIRVLSNTVNIETVADDPAYKAALQLLDGLDDTQLNKLDAMNLESGRAAYSENTLNKLADWMLTHEGDVTDAREQVFHIARDWRPPQEPVGAPLGNPPVDRSLKIAARWLDAIEQRYGRPLSVQVEHTRKAFTSVETRMKNQKEWQDSNRCKARQTLREQLAKQGDSISENSLMRREAITRQNGECLYCGAPIDITTCQMDHIVPRKGNGCTNTKDNLVAVCPTCNQEKSNMPFPAYCATESARMRGVSMKDAIRRVHHLNLDDQGYKSKAQKDLKDGIIRRLKQTEADDPIDGRSLESTSWMAVELYKRLMWRYAHDGGTPVTVNVYRGELTAEARNIMRNAVGADFHMIGGHGKTRLDRRHHAIDAAVIAMMTPAAAQAIATRISMHEAETLTGTRTDWRTCPANPTAKYQHWLEGMRRLMNLLNTALDDDRIRVLRNQRYRLGSSAAHKDTITPLTYRKLGDPLDASLIRHASTPALYTALTHLPDYNDADGLPADPERRINVNGTIIDSDDTIAFFTGDAAQILVNDGGAAVGASIHHARVYRYYTLLKSGKRKYAYGWIRVYQQDLIHAHGDLFSEPLTACTLSLRYADQTLVSAIRDGRAEYLGHLLAGDEIVIDFTDGKGAVGKFNEFFAKDIREQPSAMRRWTVTGFPTLVQTSLRPCYLSGEGLAKLEERGGEPVPKEVEKILAGSGGYTPSVNTVFSLHPAIIHRNVFGEERWDTVSGLPASWLVNDTQK